MSDLRITAILKTDLRGSTPLFYSLDEDQLRGFLDEQKQLVSQLVAERNGRIVKGEGDAFWVTFPSVTAAAQTAVQIQRELLTRQVGVLDENKTALRIVIAAGDALHHANDIFGYNVNLAARIEAVTPANEIYLSHAAYLCLNRAEIDAVLVGEFSFKGVAQPEQVYKIVQSERTIVLSDQVITVTDLQRFWAYQKTATTADVENLLLQLEKIVRGVCAANGGVIRATVGDTFVFTFPETERALTAVTTLCQQWDDFIAAHDIPCPLRVGAHYGQLAVFRFFAYGEDVRIASWLANLIDEVGRETGRSQAAVSGAAQAQVAATDWNGRLQPIDLDNAPAQRRLTGQVAYELV